MEDDSTPEPPAESESPIRRYGSAASNAIVGAVSKLYSGNSSKASRKKKLRKNLSTQKHDVALAGRSVKRANKEVSGPSMSPPEALPTSQLLPLQSSDSASSKLASSALQEPSLSDEVSNLGKLDAPVTTSKEGSVLEKHQADSGFFGSLAAVGTKLAADWVESDAKREIPHDALHYVPEMKPKVSDTVLTKLSGKRPSEEYRSDRGARLLKNMPKCSGVTESMYFALEVLHNTAGLSEDFPEGIDDLLDSIKAAFGDADSVNEYIDQISADSQPSTVMLKMKLKRGNGFVAKDTDGLSDPYAVMELQDISAEPNLRRGDLDENSPSVQVSSVCSGTLDPVWDETFEFQNIRPAQHKLTISFWDSDDVALAHKVKSVSGYRGFKRMLTDKKKALMHGFDPDDFLGWVQVDLAKIPTLGAEVKLEMQQRSTGSHVGGTVEIDLEWKTHDKDGGGEYASTQLIKLYQTLANVLVQYEYYIRKDDTGDWDGSISMRVHEILLHARLKCGLTEFQRVICEWSAAARALLFRPKDATHSVHIDSAHLVHENVPILQGKIKGLTLLGQNLKMITEGLEKNTADKFYTNDFEMMAQELDEVIINLVSEPFSYYGENRTSVEEMFNGLSAIALIDRCKICLDAAPTETYSERIEKMLQVHLFERFEQMKKQIQTEDKKNYEGKELIHAIKLCRYVGADLRVARTLFSNAVDALSGSVPNFYKMSCEHYDTLISIHIQLLLENWIPNPNKQDAGTIVFELYYELDRLLHSGFGGLRDGIALGDRVAVFGIDKCAGTVKFIGKHHRLGTEHVGIQLDKPMGDHDGTVEGHNYFHTPRNHGVFVPFQIDRGRATVELLSPKYKVQVQLRFYYHWFQTHIVGWVTTTKVNGLLWINKAIEIDEASQVTDSALHSSSVVDTFAMIYEFWDFWKKMNCETWETPTEALMLTSQVSENIQSLVVHYCKMIHNKLEKVGFYDTEGRFDISKELCITLNNLQHVLTEMKPLKEMIDEVYRIILDNQNLKEEPVHPSKGVTILFDDAWDGKRRDLVSSFDEMFDSSQIEVERLRDNLIDSVSKHVSGELKVFIVQGLELFKNPKADFEPMDFAKVTDPVLDYLDENLQTVVDFTYAEVSDNILQNLWKQSMVAIRTVYLPKDGKSLVKNANQNIIMMLAVQPMYDFFFQDGNGLTLKAIKIPEYHVVSELIELAGSETSYLIAQYYRRMAFQRPKVSQYHEMGTLKVATTLSAEKNYQRVLTVEILSGQKLVGMDNRGSSSDPSVTIRIFPEVSNGSKQVIKTKTKKKTLCPVWNETFDFILTSKISSTVLVLEIWDFDRFSSADPMGEVAIALDFHKDNERIEDDYVITAFCPDGFVKDAVRPRGDFNIDDVLVAKEFDAPGVLQLLELRASHERKAYEFFKRVTYMYKEHEGLSCSCWLPLHDYVPPGWKGTMEPVSQNGQNETQKSAVGTTPRGTNW